MHTGCLRGRGTSADSRSTKINRAIARPARTRERATREDTTSRSADRSSMSERSAFFHFHRATAAPPRNSRRYPVLPSSGRSFVSVSDPSSMKTSPVLFLKKTHLSARWSDSGRFPLVRQRGPISDGDESREKCGGVSIASGRRRCIPRDGRWNRSASAVIYY